LTAYKSKMHLVHVNLFTYFIYYRQTLGDNVRLPGAKVLRSKSSSIRQYDNINRASDTRELKTSCPQHVKTHITSFFAFSHFIHVFAPQFRTIYFALYTLTNFALLHFRTSHFYRASVVAASPVLATIGMSVCLSVCLSVTC